MPGGYQINKKKTGKHRSDEVIYINWCRTLETLCTSLFCAGFLFGFFVVNGSFEFSVSPILGHPHQLWKKKKKTIVITECA